MDAVEPALSARHKLLRRYLDGEQSDDDDATSDGPRPLRLAPHEMLDRFDEINVCAPMVRYSKHAFRALVSQYDVQITTTPMILAQEFSRSAIARDADFSTSRYERGLFWMKERGTGMKSTSWGQEERNERRRAGEGGSDVQERKAAETRQREPRGERLVRGALVCQLAASDAVTLADAAELVGPWVDGVDINCGCPQRWAYQEQIGSYLLRQPDRVRDMIRAVKARLGSDYCVSVKIRVDDDLQRTDALVRTALHAGANLLTIHGRTRQQSSTSHPVSLPAIRFAVDAARSCGNLGTGGTVPCVANGDVFTRDEAEEWRERTAARGVMSARGLLANPALFTGYKNTPPEAVSSFISLSTAWGLPFALFHRHLAYMLESQLSRSEAMHFNTLASPASVIDWLEDEYWGLALQRGQPFGASDPAVADIVKRCDGMLI